MLTRMKITAVMVQTSTLMVILGCENLPGGRGGREMTLTPAHAGAHVVKGDVTFESFIGDALGANRGYLIGCRYDKFREHQQAEAVRASQEASRHPAEAADVFGSNTADLNHDGFLTMDEIVAMQRAGLSDSQSIERISRANQVCELQPQQRDYLRDRGVSEPVLRFLGHTQAAEDIKAAPDGQQAR